MKSTRKIILLLIIVPVLTLGAGVVAGMLASRLPSRTNGLAASQQTFIAGQLNLTSEQNDQMRQIWENAHGKLQRTFEQAENLQSRREKALIDLLTDEQKAKFEPIAKEFADQRDKLDVARDKVFQDAVGQSK